MKVKATEEYKKRKVIDNELKRIPEPGEIFEVSEERFKVLNGKNNYKAVFVEEIETAKKELKVEKAVKKTTKKSK